MARKKLVKPAWKGRLAWSIIIVFFALIASSIVEAGLSPILSSFAVDQVRDSTSDYMRMNWILHQATLWAQIFLTLVLLLIWKKWLVYLWKEFHSVK